MKKQYVYSEDEIDDILLRIQNINYYFGKMIRGGYRLSEELDEIQSLLVGKDKKRGEE